MSDVLSTAQRNALDKAVQRARQVAEAAAGEELGRLAVAVKEKPSYLTDDDAALRRGLRAKARQLGDELDKPDADVGLLRADVAYEQWHRLLFARFLAENGLLRHPEHDVAVTLAECAELAAHEGEPDGWMLAARYASHILPGVFRLTDPAVQVRYSPERRAELERIVEDLDADVFRTEDALGWVYQFWQTAEKKRVNEAGDKIGGADLSPVTQLFTENYMVRFLLENSLGAWWAARHPDSPLVEGWEYLRRLDDGTPAAGTFEEWPTTAAAVTVMDPCCGSGHFLVAAFGMLWRMRAEEEGLSPADAQDAVLRDNLFGLELDPRCTQIATFNLVFEAWKQGGFRGSPVPQIACSGVPVHAARDEWIALAGANEELRSALGRLHTQFRHADTLGSLIQPRGDREEGVLLGRDLRGDDWDIVQRTLRVALTGEGVEQAVLGMASKGIAEAAALLSREYVLVVTNPPFLGRPKHASVLADYCAAVYPASQHDIAFAIVERSFAMVSQQSGSVAVVTPQSWLFKSRLEGFRRKVLVEHTLNAVAWLGEGGFWSGAAAGALVSLGIFSARRPNSDSYTALSAEALRGPDTKAEALRSCELSRVSQATQLDNPGAAIMEKPLRGRRLGEVASSNQGIKTADNPRFWREFWELADPDTGGWRRVQSSSKETVAYGGRSGVAFWEDGFGAMSEVTQDGATFRGKAAWGRSGVAVAVMRNVYATIYTGEIFDGSATVLIPHEASDLPAVWRFCSSPEFKAALNLVDKDIAKSTASVEAVPFDVERWRQVADETGGIPQPESHDPTQWLFDGGPAASSFPLQVAAARLLGYRWPDQQTDALDDLLDDDGIVALSALSGELDAASRLRALLARAHGLTWSAALEQRVVRDAGGSSGSIEEWLRDRFFEDHCRVFQQRPFLWQIWDGRKDGFSVIVNYHRLDHATLSKLTFSTLGAWIERQKNEAAEERPGAAERLGAALELQRKLTLILDGEAPYDVYVRWKEMHEQPIGWHPDLDDGVRLNIRPFVEAGVLRSKVNVHWRKDRGRNPDGSERINDLHPTLEERRAARRAAGVPL
ncbi:hypothetical protein [Cellulomonas sp. PSBB021]|uniref:Eco57I restriction-modification methylase domain-containing protein n=1 Tax=Cellulomonas sp. PSBB021 TaxID=2003551 RepID=UPI000B8D35BA|nr:hypothetical protein [Cellulomonas sp. PSBB021]ASR55533.1 hypothetical protein CBP52_11025 [Cellulomonas sp. PSBB021]